MKEHRTQNGFVFYDPQNDLCKLSPFTHNNRTRSGWVILSQWVHSESEPESKVTADRAVNKGIFKWDQNLPSKAKLDLQHAANSWNNPQNSLKATVPECAGGMRHGGLSTDLSFKQNSGAFAFSPP